MYKYTSINSNYQNRFIKYKIVPISLILLFLGLSFLFYNVKLKNNSYNNHLAVVDTNITTNFHSFCSVEYDFSFTSFNIKFDENYITHGDYILNLIEEDGSINLQEDICYISVLKMDSLAKINSLKDALDVVNKKNYRICNLSLTFIDDSKEIKSYIQKSNTLFIVAAGNYGTDLNDNSYFYPACYKYDNVITVASITDEGKLMEDSNYGNQYVDLAYYGTHKILQNTIQGTSFACARVSAIIFEMLQINPNLTNQEIKEILLNSCDTSLQGLVASNGVLNKDQAIKMAKSWQS